MAMIEDEHCECRPIRNGDVVTVAHGSNEDLDALFLEEGDDPRVQNDQGAEGSDHRWSGRFRANTPLEEEFLTNSCFTKRGSGQHITPNSNPVVADLRWQPDELTMRRVAQGLVARMLERHPKWSDHLLKLTDEAEANLKRMAADLQIEDGVVTHGYFITKDEFFGTIEANHARCERELARPRARPAAVDWNLVRDPASNRKRELEQFRNRLKAQLVS